MLGVGVFPDGTQLTKRLNVLAVYIRACTNLLKLHRYFSFVDFVERSRIRKAAVPDLVDHLRSLNIILTIRPVRHRQCSPSPDTLLMLIRNFPLTPMPKFSPEPALAA